MCLKMNDHVKVVLSANVHVASIGSMAGRSFEFIFNIIVIVVDPDYYIGVYVQNAL